MHGKRCVLSSLLTCGTPPGLPSSAVPFFVYLLPDDLTVGSLGNYIWIMSLLGSLAFFFFNFVNLFEAIVMMTTKYESRITIIFLLRILKIELPIALRIAYICSYLLFFLTKGRKHHHVVEISFTPISNFISLLLTRGNHYHYYFICTYISSLFGIYIYIYPIYIHVYVCVYIYI